MMAKTGLTDHGKNQFLGGDFEIARIQDGEVQDCGILVADVDQQEKIANGTQPL